MINILPSKKELTCLAAVKTSQRVLLTFFERILTLKIIDSKVPGEYASSQVFLCVSHRITSERNRSRRVFLTNFCSLRWK